ncbi:MAG: DoxX family protein [Panacibacter sp.]
MKKILSIKYTAGAFNFSILFLRLCFGILLILKHGMPHLMQFSTLQNSFYNFMGIGSGASLILAIFAELFCSFFIILGLFTRLAVVPVIVLLLVAVFGANAKHALIESELAIVYFSAFIILLFCGPGSISVDRMINK